MPDVFLRYYSTDSHVETRIAANVDGTAVAVKTIAASLIVGPGR